MNEARKKALGSAVFVFCLCALQSFSVTLELDRQLVFSGEVWRIWSGHFVHTNIPHLLLNIVAALLLYFAFFSTIKLAELLACSFIFTALISLALLYFYPELEWYNGLSGLLHALTIYCSIRMMRAGDMVFLVALVVVWLKVLAESTGTYLGYESLLGNMTVVTEAHLVGAFVGTITAILGFVFCQQICQVRRAKNARGLT